MCMDLKVRLKLCNWLKLIHTFTLSEGKLLNSYNELKISVSDTVLNFKLKKKSAGHTYTQTTLRKIVTHNSTIPRDLEIINIETVLKRDRQTLLVPT